MRYGAFCILLLAISEHLLVHAKKVVLVLPREIRRSPGGPWRPSFVRYKKSSQGGGELILRGYHHGQPENYAIKRPVYRNHPVPHGGDDFDQGHENVNHVQIPYGKDYSHAITFGKGYVPYDNIKGSFSFGRERYASHKQPEQEYASSAYAPTGNDYHPPGHHYNVHQSDSYFSDGEDTLDYRERRNDRKKFYASRAVEKDLGVKTHVDLNSAISRDKDQLIPQNYQRPTESVLYKDALAQSQGVEGGGAIILPQGIPPATIGGSKEGIFLRDFVALDEYQGKLRELTKSWPQFLSGVVNQHPGILNPGVQHQQANVAPRYSTANFATPATWLPEFAQSKQGYAVKEDTMESPPNYRMIPVQAIHFQPLPGGSNVATAPPQTVQG